MTVNKNNEWLLPTRGFANCFGCSSDNTKGLKLRIWYTKKGCVSYHSIPKEYCGFKGLVHGGIIATLLDELAAWTIITHLHRFGLTTEVKVRYIRPVRTEVEINIEGEIQNQLGDNVEVLTKIRSAEGELLAEAESKWLLPEVSVLQKITGFSTEEIEQLVEETIRPIRAIN